jgi:hypothetical protein
LNSESSRELEDFFEPLTRSIFKAQFVLRDWTKRVCET